MLKNKYLLLIAGIVWIIAGFNVLKIGIIAYNGYGTYINYILSLIVFLLFWFLVFKKMTKKHTVRIMSNKEEKQKFWTFFDRKSFIIMFFMITLGVTIRAYELWPLNWIAVFYTGLGTALSMAGGNFLINFFKLTNTGI